MFVSTTTKHRAIMTYTITNFIARYKEQATGTMSNGNKFRSLLYFTGGEWNVQLCYYEVDEDGVTNSVNEPQMYASFTKADAKAFLMNILAA